MTTETKNKYSKPQKCESCGTEDNIMDKKYCPYQADVHNNKVEATLCNYCYYDRCSDI